MSATKISVAMAVYNGERFLADQLGSLARQERLPDELVISDDASTDRTVEIVRDFAERAPFRIVWCIVGAGAGGIALINTPLLGVSASTSAAATMNSPIGSRRL